MIITAKTMPPILLACLPRAKYADGLPYYRQEQQFQRLGLALLWAIMRHRAIQVAKKVSFQILTFAVLQRLFEVGGSPVASRRSVCNIIEK